MSKEGRPCPGCNHPIPKGAKFCPKCGTEVVGKTAGGHKVIVKWAVVLIGAAVVVSAILLFLWSLQHGRNSGDSQDSVYVISEITSYSNAAAVDEEPVWELSYTISNQVGALGAVEHSSAVFEDTPSLNSSYEYMLDAHGGPVETSIKDSNEPEESKILRSIEYDSEGRPISIMGTNGWNITIAYSEDGSWIETMDNLNSGGQDTSEMFDANRLLVSKTWEDARGVATLDVRSERDWEGKVIEQSYLLTYFDGTTYELPGKTTYTYDSAGNVASMITEEYGRQVYRVDYTYVLVEAPGSYVKYQRDNFYDSSFDLMYWEQAIEEGELTQYQVGFH